MAISKSKQRIGVINALRAFAALAVAWGHFVAGQGKYLGLSGKYGYLGVDIFFVISGFVIPWSLYRSSYTLRDYPRFMVKRNVRLYPPYLASIAISILATNLILVPLFHIPRMTVTGRDLLLHFAYLNDLFHVRWINVVYWTLAIEFQWYLLIGLVLPLLASAANSRASPLLSDAARLLHGLLGPAGLPLSSGIPHRRLRLPVPRAHHRASSEMLGLIAAMVLRHVEDLRMAGAAGRRAHRTADRLLALRASRRRTAWATSATRCICCTCPSESASSAASRTGCRFPVSTSACWM